MQIRRFYAAEIPEKGCTVTLPPGEAQHAVRVLRLGRGDALLIMDGRGEVADAVVEDPGAGRRCAGMTCRVQSRRRVTPPACRFRLCVAPPRAKHMSALVRCAVELGVWRITPTQCQFGVSQPGDNAVEGWRADALSAVKQSGNPFLPEIDPLQPFEAVLEETPSQAVYGAVPSTCAAASMPTLTGGDIAVWVGPEGGFSDTERDAFAAHGVRPMTIGRWVLRVETAVPALMGALLGKIKHD